MVVVFIDGLGELWRDMPEDLRLIGSSLLFTIAVLLLFLLFHLLRESYSWLCGRPTADSVVDSDDDSDESNDSD